MTNNQTQRFLKLSDSPGDQAKALMERKKQIARHCENKRHLSFVPSKLTDPPKFHKPHLTWREYQQYLVMPPHEQRAFLFTLTLRQNGYSSVLADELKGARV